MVGSHLPVRKYTSIVLLALICSWPLLGCETGQKIRRGKVDDPEKVVEQGDGDSSGSRAGGGIDDGAPSEEGSERSGGSDRDESTGGLGGRDDIEVEDPLGDVDGSDRSGGHDVPVDSEASGESEASGGSGVSPDGREIGSLGNGGLKPGESPVATGNCATGDWGACFREARALVSSNPMQAIRLYERACQPGAQNGDGLACYAASLLARKSGNAALSEQFRKAACVKSRYPVPFACRKAL
jgi:hypothetical protein